MFEQIHICNRFPHLDNGLHHEGGLVGGARLEGARLQGVGGGGEGGGAAGRPGRLASTEIQRILHRSGKKSSFQAVLDTLTMPAGKEE